MEMYFMQLTSNDFEDGSPIPDKCAYRNENASPHLSWENVPEGTKSLALICNDPDAPVGDWIHWLVHDIPPDTTVLPTGGTIPGIELQNDYGKSEWGGPAPPSGTHRYFFTLYALDVPALSGASPKNFRDLCESHKIESAQLMGTYTRR